MNKNKKKDKKKTTFCVSGGRGGFWGNDDTVCEKVKACEVLDCVREIMEEHWDIASKNDRVYLYIRNNSTDEKLKFDDDDDYEDIEKRIGEFINCSEA